MSSFEPFEQQADQWWDENGPFKLLHTLNPLRLKYITQNIKDNIAQNLANLKAIDVGCGGGILTIPLSRLGMDVHGIDPGPKNIHIAKEKSKLAELKITYHINAIEKISTLKEHKEQYDVVTSMEVIEHVDDYKTFLKHLCNLLKPGGLLFISTINRTIKSFIEAIIAAEYLLKVVPRGTHEWKKFLKPSEIVEITSEHSTLLVDVTGYKLNPLTSQWRLSADNSVNYMMCFKKSSKK
jgi:2-polyprenyl-6-hydroxyphenyl methylase/3-demethylubiquinone-9 3-methyltransferase